MTVTVRHLKVSVIPDDSAAADAGEVLPSDWNAGHVVEIDALDGVPIGATTPAAGTFTTLIGGKDQVNYGQLTGGATTKAVEFKALGTDTNISQVFQSKGTGAIDLAAGSKGVNISNGGTVTAITRTATGSGYTSLPSIAISAPTTAGGVQAVATLQMVSGTATVAGGGTGYTVGDVLTVVGGTPVSGTSTYTVSTVSAGVITAVTATAANPYTALPSNPVSVTGGTGTGATLNLTWVLGATFVITNAGSGYVEQPTVTFSGGGGSGAAAYATVGSGTVVKSIGSTMSFYTPGGEALRVTDSGASTTAYWNAQGSGTSPRLTAVTSSSGVISTSSATPLIFQTNGTTSQFYVSHTASAVNYVQVTGAATGNSPAITAQGSDTDVSLRYNSKGAGTHLWYNGAGAAQFRVGAVSSAANYLRANAAIATASPALVSEGTDTNIDLALTPKGTGNVRFGTYTADMTLVVQGYITIKDSGGTVRKLAVIA